MHTAGVDLGGTKVQGVVVDGGGKRLGEARGRTPTEGGPAAVVAEITTVVKAAAKELGYRPNVLARQLATGRSGQIVVVVPYLDTPYFAELLQAIDLPLQRRPLALIAQAADVSRAVLRIVHGGLALAGHGGDQLGLHHA